MNPVGIEAQAAAVFQLPGPLLSVEPYGGGLIHKTFLVSSGDEGRQQQFILQRIHSAVFPHPGLLMDNVARVVTHLQQRARLTGRNPHRDVMCLVPTRKGATWHEIDGHAWRMMRYVAGTTSIHHAPTVSQAYQIGHAFGQFLEDLADLPVDALQEVLPGYRDTQGYLDALWRAVDEDACHRTRHAIREIGFIEAHEEKALLLQRLAKSGQRPVRAIHGDTKLNNVLLDEKTGDAVCVIDLDTVRPGLLLQDLGDCLREALLGNPEDGDVFSSGQLCVFEALLSGFLTPLSAAVSADECAHVVDAVISIALELDARFLADYLCGGGYFRTTYAAENLNRARAHRALVQRLLAMRDDLCRACARAVQRSRGAAR